MHSEVKYSAFCKMKRGKLKSVMQIYLVESKNVAKAYKKKKKKIGLQSAESTHCAGKWLLSQRFPSFLSGFKKKILCILPTESIAAFIFYEE